MKIKDQRPAGAGRDAPTDQTLPVLGLETNRLSLKSERRRVDFGGVASKQDPALADQKPDEHGGVKRGAGGRIGLRDLNGEQAEGQQAGALQGGKRRADPGRVATRVPSSCS